MWRKRAKTNISRLSPAKNLGYNDELKILHIKAKPH